MKKWLIIITILFVLFFFWALLNLAMSQENEFPYKNWKISSVRLQEGLFYIVFVNPDKESEIKATMIILLPIGEVFLKEKKPEVKVESQSY